MHLVGQRGAGTQARIGADAAVGADGGVLEQRKRVDLGIDIDRDILQHAVRADPHAVAQFHQPFEHAVHIDCHVPAAGERAAHVEARRVRQGHALLQQGVGDFALVHALQLGQLALGIHAFDFPDLRGLGCLHGDAVGHSEGDHVGEVVLLLRVLVLHAREPPRQPRRTGGEEAGIPLADRAFGLGRVLVLDDAQHAPPGVADDAAVAGRVRHHGRHHAEAALRRLDQGTQRVGTNQRHIAIKHEDMGIGIDQRQRLHHGVPRAQLRLLLGPSDIGVARKGLAHQRSPMTVDDDDLRGRKRASGVNDPAEQ